MDLKGIWTYNYQQGTKYELYRVLLKRNRYGGLRFKDVCMILYHKANIFLIALEVRVAAQLKVFVNPAHYILDQYDYFGYVIHGCQPDVDEINAINLFKNDASNFFIMDYLTKREQNVNKKELLEINRNCIQITYIM